MISPLIRGVLVIILFFSAIFLFCYKNLRGDSLVSSCKAYVMFLAISTPLLHMCIAFFDSALKISVFGFTSFVFILLNLRLFRHIPKKYLKFTAIFILILVINSLMGQFIVNSFFEILYRLDGFVLLFAVYYLVTKGKVKVIIKGLYILTAYVAIWTLIQHFISEDFTLYYLNRVVDDRKPSIFDEAQSAGCGIAMLIVWLWNIYLKSKRLSTLLVIGILLFVGGLTGSKVFLLGLVAGVALATIYSNLGIKTVLLILSVAVTIFATQDYWLELPVFKRMQEMDSSYDLRSSYFWYRAYLLFLKFPIFGIGIGNFYLYNKYHGLNMHYPNGELATQPESGYMMMLDEMGLLSLIYVFMIGYLMYRKGNNIFNFSIIVPWLVSFVSLYNLGNQNIYYMLFLFGGMILATADMVPRKTMKLRR